MIKKPFNIISGVQRLMYKPMYMFLICLGIVFFKFIIEGHLIQLWRMYRDSNEISKRTEVLKSTTAGLKMKIKRASELDFIEREARGRFNFVEKDDLIFIFTDEP